MKEMYRATFMLGDIATPEDFERLWPRLRDDFLCSGIQDTVAQTLTTLNREADDKAES